MLRPCSALLLFGCSTVPIEPPDASVYAQSDAAVNGCTTYIVVTPPAAATITGPSTATPSQYTPNCVQIRVGESVRWNVDFADHPLAQGPSTAPSPISSFTSGTTATVTFPSLGTYGFLCKNHPSVMFGAVWVVP